MRALPFVGTYESSSCPDEVQEVTVTGSMVSVAIGWVAEGGDCIPDANERSFIIELASSASPQSVEVNGAARPMNAS